jgi:hypothetical protein
MMSPPKEKFSPFAAHEHGARSAALDGVDGGSQLADHLVVDAVLRRPVQDDGGGVLVEGYAREVMG